MRVIPRSMAGRTTLVLGAGLVLVLLFATLVSSVIFFDETRAHRSTHLVERALTIAVAIGATPQRARSDVLQAMSGLGFHGSWTADRSLDPVVSPDWWTIWYQRRLAQALREFGAGRVLIGHEAAGPADGGAVTVVGHGPLYVWVELPDSTWLSLRADENWYDPALIVEPFLVFLLIGVGIIGLAVVVARRVTAPLGRFAAAAAQPWCQCRCAAALRDRSNRNFQGSERLQRDAISY